MLISKVERELIDADVPFLEVLQVWQGNCTEALAEISTEEGNVEIYWIAPSGVRKANRIRDLADYIRMANEVQ